MDLDNPEGRLRPGLYAHARIVAEEHAGALTVPASAVVRDGAKRFCLVVADGRARRVEVRTGIADGPRVEVVSGLDPGDLVVTAGAESLTDGQPVRPVQPDVPAKPAAKP